MIVQFGDQRLMTGVIIQQLPLRLAPQQGLMFVLAVNVHQPLAQITQGLRGLRRPVDVAAGTPIAGDHPPQLTVPLLLQIAFRQPGAGGW